MTVLIAFLSVAGLLTTIFGITYVMIQLVESQLTLMSEVRACKREIERLENLIKEFHNKQG